MSSPLSALESYQPKTSSSASDDPRPCIACGSPFAWLTVYGDRKCWECDQPPSFGLIRERLALVVTDEGLAWERHPRHEWRPGNPLADDVEDSEEVYTWQDGEFQVLSLEPRPPAWQEPRPVLPCTGVRRLVGANPDSSCFQSKGACDVNDI